MGMYDSLKSVSLFHSFTFSVRLVSQLATIYYSVKLDYFKALLADLDMPFLEIEKTVIKVKYFK